MYTTNILLTCKLFKHDEKLRFPRYIQCILIKTPFVFFCITYNNQPISMKISKRIEKILIIIIYINLSWLYVICQQQCRIYVSKGAVTAVAFSDKDKYLLKWCWASKLCAANSCHAAVLRCFLAADGIWRAINTKRRKWQQWHHWLMST